MSSLRRYALVWLVFAIIGVTWLRVAYTPAIDGVVAFDASPVAEARVGWQGERDRVTTDVHGRFQLPLSAKSRFIVANKSGFRIASTTATNNPLVLHFERLPATDNEDYLWIDPHPDPSQPNNCANCHADIYREWLGSAHARSATNPKFLHLFAGTDGKSPAHKTWNVQVEHPDGAAVCAKCHAPTLNSPTLDYDVREAKGVARSGVHCDYCHKVADVPAGKFGTRFGRDGMELLRPAQGDLLSFGPLDDAVRKGESFACLPVYKESRYCASCHEGIVFGVHAYGTYSEWLESPAKKAGKQCQDCHMTPTGKMTNIAPGKGGIERHPSTLASHHTPGGERDMLRQSLQMRVDIKSEPERQRRTVDIEITAQNVGHRVPTGFVDRQLILVVEASDADGQRVSLLEGTRLPASTGKWSGLPGALFAKQLFDEKGRTPVPFWLPILKIEDTRLQPDAPERRLFAFPATAQRLTVQLWYRRFWQEVADARGWTDNDFLVQEQVASMKDR